MCWGERLAAEAIDFESLCVPANGPLRVIGVICGRPSLA
jgi:hypothetical protein